MKNKKPIIVTDQDLTYIFVLNGSRYARNDVLHVTPKNFREIVGSSKFDVLFIPSGKPQDEFHVIHPETELLLKGCYENGDYFAGKFKIIVDCDRFEDILDLLEDQHGEALIEREGLSPRTALDRYYKMIASEEKKAALNSSTTHQSGGSLRDVLQRDLDRYASIPQVFSVNGVEYQYIHGCGCMFCREALSVLLTNRGDFDAIQVQEPVNPFRR